MIVDESHITIPQVRGMYAGDRSRKQTLVDFGFRLPSALDNRPLNFDEFEERIDQMLFVSATPNVYEGEHEMLRAEQIIRPTGLLDPPIDVRPVEGQIDDLISEINKEVAKKNKVLVTTLTKRMAEDLTAYMKELDIRVKYLHSDIDTLERIEIVRDLRMGVFDVLVGINLLREGLDIPEVTLIAILDADKEGFYVQKLLLYRQSDVPHEMQKDTLLCTEIRLQTPCVPPSQKQSGVVKFRWHIMKNMALRQRLFKRQFGMSFLLPMKKHQRRAEVP